MFQKKFFIKNYLEPINPQFGSSESFVFSEKEQKTENFAYPFTLEQLASFLKSENCLDLLSLDSITNEPNSFNKKLEGFEILSRLSSSFKEKEIEKEKRRRHQAYKFLEYNLSNFTYFDFFSQDAFKLAENSKYLAQIYDQSNVSGYFLLLAFFDSEFKIGQLLASYGFDYQFIQEFSDNLKNSITEKQNAKKKKNSLLENFSLTEVKKICTKTLHSINHNADKFYDYLKSFVVISEFENLKSEENHESDFNQDIFFSYQTHKIFQKSAENALHRFRTPIITPEIIFITLVEENNFFPNLIIKTNLENEITWYLLRYKLLKRLYHQETNIRNQVPKNQYFFAYLLKTQLSESNFEKLILKKVLNQAVNSFRNLLIRETLDSNFIKNFESETNVSLFFGSNRSYSL